MMGISSAVEEGDAESCWGLITNGQTSKLKITLSQNLENGMQD